jgi:hypothetical protein
MEKDSINVTMNKKSKIKLYIKKDKEKSPQKLLNIPHLFLPPPKKRNFWDFSYFQKTQLNQTWDDHK